MKDKLKELDNVIIEMYCQPCKKSLGGFFSDLWGGVKKVATGVSDAITGPIKKAASVVGDIVDAGVSVAKGVVNTGTSLVNSVASSAGNIVQGAGQGVGALVSDPNFLKQAANVAAGIATGGTSSLANLASGGAGGLSSILGSLTSGGLSNILGAFTGGQQMAYSIPNMITQSAMPYINQAAASGTAMIPTYMQQVSPYYQQYANQMAMQQPIYPQYNYPTMRGINIKGSYNPELALQKAMENTGYSPYGLTFNNRNNISLGRNYNIMSDIINNTEYIDIKGINALQSALNTPNAILGIIKFSEIVKPEKALETYINTQKIASSIRGGNSPINIAKNRLLGISLSLSKIKSFADEAARIAESYNSNYDKDTIIAYGNEAALIEWEKYADSDMKRGAQEAWNQAVLDGLKEKPDLTSKFQRRRGMSAARNYYNNLAFNESSSSDLSSDSGLSSLSTVKISDTRTSPTSSILSQNRITGEESLTKATDLIATKENVLNDLKSESLAVANILKTSAINKLRESANKKVASLAQQIASGKIKNIQEAANKLITQNEILQKEINEKNEKYSKIADDYRNALLNNKQELVNQLKYDKDRLLNMIIKAYSELDSAKNEMLLLKKSLEKVLASSNNTSASYQDYAKINDDFAKKIAFLNSIGIKEVAPEAIERIYNIVYNSITNSSEYQQAIREENNLISKPAISLIKQRTSLSPQLMSRASSNNLRKMSISSNNNFVKTNKLFRGIGLSNASNDNLPKADHYLANTILIKLTLAGYLLNMARTMEISDARYANYIFERVRLNNIYNVILADVQTLIEDYLSGNDLRSNSDTKLAIRSEQLTKIIGSISAYIKTLVFRDQRFLVKSKEYNSLLNDENINDDTAIAI